MILTPEFAPYQPKHLCRVCELEVAEGRASSAPNVSDYTPRRAA